MSPTSPPSAADSVIGNFYEAALDPPRWGEGLAGLARLAGARGAISFRGSLSSLEAWVTDQVGQDPATVAAYNGHYFRLDPLAHRSVHAPVGSWMNDWRLFGAQGFARSEWYNDFLRRHGNHAVLACMAVREGDLMATLSLQRALGQPAFTEDDERRLAPVLPHLRRASQLHFATAGAVLEHVAQAVWVLDEAGRVALANRCAQQDAGLLFKVRHGVLEPRAQSARWRVALRRATAAAGARADWLLLAADPQGPVAVLVAPLTPQAALARPFQKPMAVVMAQLRPGATSATGEDPLVTLHGLTAAEARVARRLGAGRSVAEIADEARRSPATVRVQLKSAFAKLGVRRQVDLVRLVNALALPQLPKLPG
jgi:DNA-binding CsgD family transcriptional regulator